MKHSGVFLAALLLSGVAAAAPGGVDDVVLPERVLPALEPLLDAAVSRSPQMLSRLLDREIAEENRLAARAGLLPQVTATYRDLQARDDRADVAESLAARKVYYDVTVTQPLFHWGERRNALRMAEIRQAMTEGRMRDAYRQLATEIRFQFLRLIVQKARIDRARLELRLATAARGLAEARLAAGTLAEADLLAPRLRVEAAEIDLERAEFELNNSRRGLARLTGAEALTEAQIPDGIPELAYAAGPYDRLLTAFLAQSEFPTLSAMLLRQDLAVDRLALANQKTRLRPKVDLVAGANQDEQSYTLNTAQKYAVDSRFVGVQVSWTIFDSFAARSAVRAALAALRKREAEYAGLTEALAEQAQAQARLIYFSARAMSVSDRLLAAAGARLAARESEARQGTASENDVSLAHLAALDSRISAFNARIEFLARITEFLGTLNEDPVAAKTPAKP